jgi:glucose/arabinose dehydrogenase
MTIRRIPIGRRIRDIAIDNEGVVWLVTDDAMLVKISNDK